jgi:multidrug efflux pump subunit AcrA (membrane-fusion protein)
MIRWIAAALIIAALGWGIYLAIAAFFGKPAAAAQDRAASAAAAADGPVKIFAGGTVEGSRRELSLRFEIPGRLKEILVQPGSRVAKGDVLAQLDPEIWELKFTEARTLLQLARAERDRVVRQHDELRKKQERSGLPLPADRSRPADATPLIHDDDLTIAEAKVTLAEGALRRERVMLEKTMLLAPTDGVVLRVLGEPGEMVGPGDERDLVTLVNRDRTRVRAHVEELDALSVAVGQKAFVTAEGHPDREYAGIVQSCSPCVAPKSHRHLKPGEMFDIRVREIIIELTDGADLLIGLPVDVFIEPGVAGNGESSPADSYREPPSAQNTAEVASPARRTSRSFADPSVRPASHLTDASRRR